MVGQNLTVPLGYASAKSDAAVKRYVAELQSLGTQVSPGTEPQALPVAWLAL